MTAAIYIDFMSRQCRGQENGDLKDLYETVFQTVSDAGYQWVDLSSWEVDALGVKNTLLLLQKYGLKVSSYIHFESFAELEMNPPESFDRAFRGIDKTAILGSEFMMIGIQDRGDIRNTDSKKIREILISYCNGICGYANNKKVRPVIENIPDAGLSLCKWEDVRAFMDQVPSLGYIFDSGTILVAEEGSKEYISALKDRLVYVHLKDMKESERTDGPAFVSLSGKWLVNAPTGKGLVDMKTVLKQLTEIGYQDRLSVEFCPDKETDFSDSVRESKEYTEKMLQQV